MKTEVTLQTLIINHRHGTDLTVHQTTEEASASLYEYVKNNWMEMEINGDCPEDQDEAIDLYFEEMSASESYTLDAQAVQIDIPAPQLSDPQRHEMLTLLWDYLKKDKGHKDRRQTGYGTKTIVGLIASIEGIFAKGEK